MSKHHKLKLYSEFWDDVMNGDKCFEVRNNDRDFHKGDTVSFVKYDKCGVFLPHNQNLFEITYVLSGWGIQNGYVVFGIKRKEEENAEG